MKRNPLASDPVREVLFALYLLLAVLGLWQRPVAVLAVVMLGVLFQMLAWHRKEDIALLVTGALLGILGEYRKGISVFE